MTLCSHPTRYGPCTLEAGHRGNHSVVTFVCDGCGKIRRGVPHQQERELAFCFFCTRPGREY